MLSKAPGQTGECSTARVAPKTITTRRSSMRVAGERKPDRRLFCVGAGGQLEGGGLAGAISPLPHGMHVPVRLPYPDSRRQYGPDRTPCPICF